MGKGFGTKAKQQLGYVLDLMPQVHAYAAKFVMDFPGDEGPFIGITSELSEAQIWKRPKLAKQAILDYYSDFLLGQQKQGTEIRVLIKRLIRTGEGDLKTETVETLTFIDAADLRKTL